EVGGNGNVFGYDSSVSLDPALSEDPSAGICSNNVTIDIFGNAVIDADVRPGVNGIVDITGNAEVTGNTAALPIELVYPSIPVPTGAIAWPYPTRMNSSTPVNVPPAVYTISSSDFTMNAQSSIVISGPTEIYINGDVTLNGQNFTNTTGDPHNLKIYVIGDHNVRINGGADFYGLIYAPTSTVDVLGNADFYGAIISAEVDFNGTGTVYMDTSLMDNVIKGGVKLIR
nr:hypothetical protein [Deltaproteobacteria bacterium]